MGKEKVAAIIVAAGKGKRIPGNTPKQYMLLNHKMVLYYTITAYEQSKVDEIILVVGEGEEEFVKKELVFRYSFQKVTQVLAGGEERYDSVYAGLNFLQANSQIQYVLIQDGARPLIQPDLINQTIEAVSIHQACVVGVPAKDTVKLVNENCEIVGTPNRSLIWMVQTPQAFSFDLIKNAYDLLIIEDSIKITDDAMAVELSSKQKIHMLEGDYRNIKITTEDDLEIAEHFLFHKESAPYETKPLR